MGYLHDFKYDIFISYTHLDNHAPEGVKGWIDQFHNWLFSGLLRRFGWKKIVIWRDNQLHGHTLFEERIPEVVKSSALFLALTSQHYLNSEYCQKELGWFYENAKANSYGLSVQGEKRIFNILLNNIDHSLWPEALSGTSAFPFHDAPKESYERGEPLDPRELLFNKQLRKIIDAIEVTLVAFSKLNEENQIEPPKLKIQVFVANVADSLLTTRNRLIKDLIEAGEEVTSEIPPPWENDAYSAHVSQILQKCNLAINLLDSSPGSEIENFKGDTYPRRQAEIALESPIPQIIWVPKNLDLTEPPDSAQVTFLNALENGPHQKKNLLYMQSDYPEFYQAMLHFIEEIKHFAQISKESETVLLDSHQKDQLFAFELGAYLARNGLDVVFNQESRSPVETLNNFEKSLENVRQLIIVFGMVDQNWVKQRIQKITQLMATRMEQIKAENCWLYLVPPEKRVNELPTFPRLLNIQLLDGSYSKTFQADIVAPVLNCCRKRRPI